MLEKNSLDLKEEQCLQVERAQEAPRKQNSMNVLNVTELYIFKWLKL